MPEPLVWYGGSVAAGHVRRSDVILPRMPFTPVGACSTCVHQKIIRSGRGSEFSMCLRHRTDPAYAKYPPIPVLRCPGHEQRPEPDA